MKLIFLNEHNHYLDCANNVRHTDVSDTVRLKFLDLFAAGHSPYSALDIHKMDLQNKHGEDYYVAVANRNICPDLAWCYRYVTQDIL